MPLTTLQIFGLRSFGEKQTVPFAVPNGKPGSGLTMLVGPNGSGKTTIIEALQYLARPDTNGLLNASALGRLSFEYTDDQGRAAMLGSDPEGGGEIRWRLNELNWPKGHVFVVPSRRSLIERSFQNSEWDRPGYASSRNPGQYRLYHTQQFGGRLVRMNKNRKQLDAVLREVFGTAPAWTIEPNDDGTQRLRFYARNGGHLSDGIADGIASMLFIADALYDAPKDSIIAIDEPELSLHPPIQRRLSAVLANFARQRQIIYTTHSVYLADWEYVLNGAQLVRVSISEGSSRVRTLSATSTEAVRGFLRNMGNPHLLGLDAREVFFLDDRVLLVEGQEDVLGYRLISRELGIDLSGEYYGWGVGGATNMPIISRVLNELGFEKVVGILDEGQEKLKADLANTFRRFSFFTSPAQDMRAKKDRKDQRTTLLDEHWQLRDEYKEPLRVLLNEANKRLE